MTITDIGRQNYDKAGCEGSNYNQILQQTGITYRQLNMWTRSGRVKAHYHVRGGIIQTAGGSGTHACWPPDQVAIIQRVATLMRACFDMNHAFTLATNLQACSKALFELTIIQADLIEENWDDLITY